MNRLLRPCLAGIVLTSLTGCTEETPVPRAADAWVVPQDFCDRIDLDRHARSAGWGAVRRTQAERDEDGALCAAMASALTVEVWAVAPTTQTDIDRAYQSATVVVAAPEAWSELGEVKTSTPNPAGAWARSRSGLYAADETFEENGATRIRRADAVADGNLVARLLITATVPESDREAGIERVTRLADLVLEAVPGAVTP